MSVKFDFYLDMDDTLVATSPTIQEKYNYPEFWIHSATKTRNPVLLLKSLKIWLDIALKPLSWEHFPPKHNYLDLFMLAQKFDEHPKILTALPVFIFRKNTRVFSNASSAKSKWLEKHIPHIQKENIHFTYSKLKHLYVNASENIISILVDDNPGICKKWIAKGGIAYQINCFNEATSIAHIEQQLSALLNHCKNNPTLTKNQILDYFNKHK